MIGIKFGTGICSLLLVTTAPTPTTPGSAYKFISAIGGDSDISESVCSPDELFGTVVDDDGDQVELALALEGASPGGASGVGVDSPAGGRTCCSPLAPASAPAPEGPTCHWP